MAGSLAVLTAITVAVLIWRRPCPYLAVGWFWFLGVPAPVLGLLTISAHAMADRYMYLPQIGLAIAAGWGAAAVGRRIGPGAPALAGGAVAAIVAWIGCAIVQTTYWGDDLALWTHALPISGDGHNVDLNLAYALGKAGRLDEAVEQYHRGCAGGPTPLC